MRTISDAAALPRLILEIDIGERLPVVVAHDKAGVLFVNGPRQREAARHDCPSFVRPRHPAAPLAPNIGLIVGSHIERKIWESKKC
jgi:hypothetical protein